jgi:hypothetical protein
MGSSGLRVDSRPVRLSTPGCGALVCRCAFSYCALFFCFAHALDRALCAVTLSEHLSSYSMFLKKQGLEIELS